MNENEHLGSRKRPTSDKRIDDKADKDEDEVEKITNSIATMQLTLKQRRKEREDKGINEKGWIGNNFKVVRHCPMCGDRTEKGLKCEACIHKLCRDWLSKAQLENNDAQVSKHPNT